MTEDAQQKMLDEALQSPEYSKLEYAVQRYLGDEYKITLCIVRDMYASNLRPGDFEWVSTVDAHGMTAFASGWWSSPVQAVAAVLAALNKRISEVRVNSDIVFRLAADDALHNKGEP